MSEPTKTMLTREFIQRAKSTNGYGDLNALYQFAREVILPSDKNPAVRQPAVLTFADNVATLFDGSSYQIPQTFDRILDRIPDEKVRKAVRKIGVLEGVAQAVGWPSPK